MQSTEPGPDSMQHAQNCVNTPCTSSKCCHAKHGGRPQRIASRSQENKASHRCRQVSTCTCASCRMHFRLLALSDNVHVVHLNLNIASDTCLPHLDLQRDPSPCPSPSPPRRPPLATSLQPVPPAPTPSTASQGCSLLSSSAAIIAACSCSTCSWCCCCRAAAAAAAAAAASNGCRPSRSCTCALMWCTASEHLSRER